MISVIGSLTVRYGNKFPDLVFPLRAQLLSCWLPDAPGWEVAGSKARLHDSLFLTKRCTHDSNHCYGDAERTMRLKTFLKKKNYSLTPDAPILFIFACYFPVLLIGKYIFVWLQFQILFLKIMALFKSSFFKSHCCRLPPWVTFN